MRRHTASDANVAESHNDNGVPRRRVSVLQERSGTGVAESGHFGQTVTVVADVEEVHGPLTFAN